jgi:pyruvate/2-oxoglutarate dehydrogenase complex dihydrolipoamide dehydrogenase (E3) component
MVEAPLHAHRMYNDFEIVAANLRATTRVGSIECYGPFIDPPLGRVGLTEQAACDAGLLHWQRQMTRVGRARDPRKRRAESRR